MSFLTPSALWFLLALIPLAALFLLKVRPERRITTAMFLWQKVFQEKRSSALFEKLRDLLSLILCALALAAIAFAMARPVFDADKEARDLLLLIDNSASMSAFSKGRETRLDEAKTIARNIVRNLGGERQVAVAAISDRLEMASSATANAREAVDGIDGIRAGFRPFAGAALEALKVSGALAGRRTILISDGCFRDSDKLDGIELLKVGMPLENIGICAFDVARIPGMKDRIEVFFQLASSLKADMQVELTLCRGSAESPVKVFNTTAVPGIAKGERFSLESEGGEKWLLLLERKDQFMQDNQAFAFLPEPDPLGVEILADDESPFFSRCVAAFERSGGSLKPSGENPAISALLGARSGSAKARRLVIYKPEGKSPFWASLGDDQAASPAVVMLREHPSVKHAALDNFTFQGVKRITPPENSTIIVTDADGTPVLYKTRAEGCDTYVFNMDPVASEFFQSVAFPVSLCSMALDLAKKEESSKSSFPPGSGISIQEPAELLAPDGSVAKIGPETPAELEIPGFYELKGAQTNKTLACSMQAPEKSLLDNSDLKDSSKPLPKGRPISNALLILALLVLALESAFYHRRKAG